MVLQTSSALPAPLPSGWADGLPVPTVPQRRSTTRTPDEGSVGVHHPRKLNTEMSHFVSFFAALNRPSRRQPVGQYKAHTTYEEMLGLL